MPIVSVLMPVFNAGPFLRESIESILRQTFHDFEFIIINDGSTDDSEEIIFHYADPRIIYLKNNVNKGIIETLNQGISLASGCYIARMDADDISLQERIECQVDFMEDNPHVGVSGTWVEYFGNRSGIIKTPVSHQDIVWTMLEGSPFFHPSVIMRRELLTGNGILYPFEYPHAEDYALWVQLLGLTVFANLPRVLLKYRFFEGSVSSKFRKEQLEYGSILRRDALERLAGRRLEDEEWRAIDGVSGHRLSLGTLGNVYREVNEKNGLFPDHQFRKTLNLRVKQRIMQNRIDRQSYLWLLGRSIRDPSLLKYVVNSLKK